MFKPYTHFIAFDLETTGLDAEKDVIIEIGAVKMENGLVTERFSRVVHCEQTLSLLVRKLTGISDEELKSGDPLVNVLNDFLVFAGALPLIAHNAEFDSTFIQSALQKAGLPVLSNAIFDSLFLARLAWPTLANHRLETLAEALQLPKQPAHRALPDAEKTVWLWKLAQEKMQSYSEQTLVNIHQLLADSHSIWLSLFSQTDSPTQPVFGGVKKSLSALSTEYVPTQDWNAVFAAEGKLALALASSETVYRKRNSQAYLASRVQQGLQRDELMVLETQPGLGKTIAYLLPLVQKAIQHRRRAMVVVGSKALRLQIEKKEFPLLEKMEPDASLCVLKAPEFYLSKRRFAAVLENPKRYLTPEECLAFLPLLTWTESTVTGDIQENAGFNADRHKLLWSKLNSHSYLAEGGYSESYATEAKQKALASHIMLIHPALFFRNLELDLSLLPSFNDLVYDEADNLLDPPPEYTGSAITFFRLRNALQLLAQDKDNSFGLCGALQGLQAEWPEARRMEVAALLEKAFEPEKQLQKFFNKIAKHAKKRRREGESKIRYNTALAFDFNADPEPVILAIEEVSSLLTSLHGFLESCGGEAAALAPDLKSLNETISKFQREFRHISQPVEGEEIYWMEEYLNPHKILLAAQTLSPASLFSEKLYPYVDSILFISSAVSVQEQFHYFTKNIGLKDYCFNNRKKLFTQVIYDKHKPAWNAFLMARFCPLPTQEGSSQFLAEMLGRTLPQIPRNTFVLYTNVQNLKNHQAYLQAPLATKDRMLLAQHVDGSRENLIQLFRQWDKSCLLGTGGFLDSNAAAADMELLVVIKLPFPIPSEPKVAARMDEIANAGKNPLFEFVIPEAVLQLKRELQRFLPGESKPKAIWVLDPRLGSDKYSSTFMKSLPQDIVIAEKEEDLVQKTLAALGIGAETPTE